MNRHDELRSTWVPGQVWETRNDECAQDPDAWVPVRESGRAEPLWDERQEYRQRPDDGAKQVPLTEQLRSVPADAVLRIDTPNALGCMDTRSIPVGRLCHEAADVTAGAEGLAQLRAIVRMRADGAAAPPPMATDIDPENQYIGDLMILQVLADSDIVNDQEREVLLRWIEISQPPGAMASNEAQQENAPGPEAVLVAHAGGLQFVPRPTGTAEAVAAMLTQTEAMPELQRAADEYRNIRGYASADALLRAVDALGVPVLGRVLDEADPFCPKCGHNRDTSSVSSVDLGGSRKGCQFCGTEWDERPASGVAEVRHQTEAPAGTDAVGLALEATAREIYDGWKDEPGWVPWVTGGNSTKQDVARQRARDVLAGDPGIGHE